MSKRLSSIALTLLLVLNYALADVPGPMKVVSAPAGNIFTLHYQTPPTSTVKVSIINNHNTVVFTETITETGAFTRPYNFSQLEKGEYKIIVQDKSGRQEQSVKYGIADAKSYIKISEMNKEESRFILNIGSAVSQSVIVRIYDNAKGLVHEQVIKVEGNYGMIYNLSKVRSSSKSIVMFEVSTAAGQVQTAMF